MPTFAEARAVLPEPHWEGHDEAIRLWWYTWERAFAHLRAVPLTLDLRWAGGRERIAVAAS